MKTYIRFIIQIFHSNFEPHGKFYNYPIQKIKAN